jgi:hypothetical protein
MTVTVDGETMALRAGEAVFVSRGAVHGFFNHGSGDARILVIASPGPAGAEDYIHELAALLGAAGDRGPDLVMLDEAMRRHGYVPAPDSRTSST